MYNRILFLDNNIIYPIYSYEVDFYNKMYYSTFYYQYDIKINIKSWEVDKNFLINLNKTNYDDTKIVLFTEDNLKCLVFDKSYLKPFLKSDFNLTLSFKAVRLRETYISQIDTLKYIKN